MFIIITLGSKRRRAFSTSLVQTVSPTRYTVGSSAASNSVSLREAYDSIFDRLPLCQRIIRHKKYLPLFLDEQISEYVLQRIIGREKDRQGLVMAEALGVSFDVGVSVFVFLVHGLYAVNKQYKWSQSDEWLEAQKIIFELVYRGLQSK